MARPAFGSHSCDFTRQPEPEREPDFVDTFLDNPARVFILQALNEVAAYGFDTDDPDIMRRAIRKGEADYQREVERHNQWLTTQPKDGSHDTLVYYMRLGDLVKIGFTTNLHGRCAALNPQEVMATEPGGEPAERRRHKQFAHLRVHGEWFTLSPELRAHIADLSDAQSSHDGARSA